jgi:BirA family biotin operon repressor/biotin-[acetyl-CoA-carboxylase] ligase
MTRDLIVLDSAVSTQDAAREMAVARAPSGAAVMALEQTGGRGRGGKTWVSPAGRNLALSCIVRPNLTANAAPLVGLLASLGVASALRDKGLADVQLKWPNDVIVKDRKIAGILPEAKITGAQIEFMIMGIGLNVNADLTDFPGELRDRVTSYRMLTGNTWDVTAAGRHVLEHVTRLLTRMDAQGPEFIPREWARFWAHQGRFVRRDDLVGRAHGIAPDGSLLLLTHDGSVTRVNSGVVEPVEHDDPAVRAMS